MRFANINLPSMPAQREAEVLGTLEHAQLYVLVKQLSLCSFLRHW